MNTVIGHLEKILEQQQKQQNTNKAKQNTSSLLGTKAWELERGGFDRRCMHTLRILQSALDKQEDETVFGSEREEEGSDDCVEITQRPKSVSRTLWGKEQWTGEE